MLSKLNQQRYYLEKSCEKIGKMLPVCVIFRWRKRGTRDFQSTKAGGKPVKQEEGKVYSYMTYLEGGVTRHHYIRKDELDNILPKAEEYRQFSKKLAQIRYLNKRIVEILDEIGKIQMEEVKKHVKEKKKRTGTGRKEPRANRKAKDKKEE
jgi:hypothetical protein